MPPDAPPPRLALPPAPHGRVLVLNGTSSAGKSTLLRALQERLEGAWLGVGIDTVVFALPKRYLDPPHWAEVFRYVPPEPGADVPFRIETGELGQRLIRGLHATVAALAAAGHGVIVDHVLLERAWLDDLAERLRTAGAEVCFVGVRCDLATVVERERQRRDRTLGQAAAQWDVVHRAGGYDVEVDTGRLDPAAAADAVIAAIRDGFPPTAFGRLAQARAAAERGSTSRPIDAG